MKHACMHGARALFTALALVTAASSTWAHDNHAHHGHAPKSAGTVRLQLPDTALTDHRGKTARFKSQLLGDRLVLVNFIYTTCTTVCPAHSALFADVQQRLGERAGRDVALVTLTVDPVRDTPLRLKEFSAPYQPGAGWSFLGGRKQNVDEVLKALDAYTPNFVDHPAAVLVGDPRTGEWTRFFGFPSSAQLLARVDELQAARQAATGN